jgi:WD40-like Beta Propeller Repeat
LTQLLAALLLAANLGTLVLTVAGGDLSHPRLSPDGRRLAYARGNEVRVVIVATRHTDAVIPARYGALRELEWSDDEHVAASYAKTRVTADVIHRRRTTSKPSAPPPQSFDFCGTTLRATTEAGALTLWRTTGPETLPLATIYPAAHGAIDVRRTTPAEVIFVVRGDTENHLLSYDGIRLRAYGIDGLDDASFSRDGRRIAISVWTAGQRRLFVYER